MWSLIHPASLIPQQTPHYTKFWFVNETDYSFTNGLKNHSLNCGNVNKTLQLPYYLVALLVQALIIMSFMADLNISLCPCLQRSFLTYDFKSTIRSDVSVINNIIGHSHTNTHTLSPQTQTTHQRVLVTGAVGLLIYCYHDKCWFQPTDSFLFRQTDTSSQSADGCITCLRVLQRW